MLVYYVNLSKHLYDVRYNGARARIFGPDHYDADLVACKPWHMIQFFATEALHKDWARIMNATGADDRLLSYWYLKNKPNEVLERFVTTGKCGEYEQSPLRQNWLSENYRNRRRLALVEHLKRTEREGYADEKNGPRSTPRVSLPRVGRE
jgi:hypothetical protein